MNTDEQISISILRDYVVIQYPRLALVTSPYFVLPIAKWVNTHRQEIEQLAKKWEVDLSQDMPSDDAIKEHQMSRNDESVSIFIVRNNVAIYVNDSGFMQTNSPYYVLQITEWVNTHRQEIEQLAEKWEVAPPSQTASEAFSLFDFNGGAFYSFVVNKGK